MTECHQLYRCTLSIWKKKHR